MPASVADRTRRAVTRSMRQHRARTAALFGCRGEAAAPRPRRDGPGESRSPGRDRLAEHSRRGLEVPLRLARAPLLLHPTLDIRAPVPQHGPVEIVGAAASGEVVDRGRTRLLGWVDVVHLEPLRAGAALPVGPDPGAPVAVALQHRAADGEENRHAHSRSGRPRGRGLARPLPAPRTRAACRASRASRRASGRRSSRGRRRGSRGWRWSGPSPAGPGTPGRW